MDIAYYNKLVKLEGKSSKINSVNFLESLAYSANGIILASLLRKIEEEFGFPVRVHSGFICEKLTEEENLVVANENTHHFESCVISVEGSLTAASVFKRLRQMEDITGRISSVGLSGDTLILTLAPEIQEESNDECEFVIYQ